MDLPRLPAIRLLVIAIGQAALAGFLVVIADGNQILGVAVYFALASLIFAVYGAGALVAQALKDR